MTQRLPFESVQSHRSILVVEDEPDTLHLITEALEGAGLAVAQAASGAEAVARLNGFAYDGLVIDLQLPDANGMDILTMARALYPNIRAVVITGFGAVPEAVQAIRSGAIDFLLKPFELAELSRVLHSSLDPEPPSKGDLDRGMQAGEPFRFGNMVGSSAPMQQVFAMLKLVAPMNSTVLIQGETGTGKELIARTIHANSPRRDQAFVAFNAAAIPESLAEAELFGHVKGAFTGAVNARVGRFEFAHRGTLFIDEVASMSLTLQAKLLRAIQERTIERVGDCRPIRFDTRIIAAANTDLKTLVKEGKFREDLFYRLNVISVTLPPLRARPEDLPLLAQHFVQKSCKSNGVPPRTLSQETVRTLMSCSWPGNIRQLENAVEHAVAMSGDSSTITVEMLPQELERPEETTLLSRVAIPDEGVNFAAVVSQLERELILRCLEKTRGNKRQAARLLQLSRTTLIDKLHRLAVRTSAA